MQTESQKNDSPRFNRHKSAAKWERGSFSLPNKLCQDMNLTDSAYRLLTWMHSCADEWVIYQTDIMNRFGWGHEKLRSAINNLISCKYLIKFPQTRKADGGWGPCSYEFCTQGFTDEEIKIISPMSGDPISDESISDNPTSKQILIKTNPNLKDGVCKREDPPLEKSELSDHEKKPERLNGSITLNVIIKPPRGDPYNLSKEDLIRRYLRKFTSAEFEEAWDSLINCKAPIVDPYEYLEATVINIRNELKLKQKAEYCKRNGIKQNNLNGESCQKVADISQKDSQKKSKISRENFVGIVLSEPPSLSLTKLL